MPLTTVSPGVMDTQATATWRNRIINGDMRIDQRNAGASVTPANNQYLVDRFFAVLTQTSRVSAQQNAGAVTPPSGFTNYLGVTSLSAYSVLAGDAFALRQIIEGFNVSDLGWGTANAQAVTVSFWVRSSLTGSFGGNIANGAFNRSYPFSYTISAANTWEYKTVTIPGDTTGTWLTDNGRGIALTFGLGYGSSLSGAANAWNAGTAFMPTGAVSVVGTNGATFYITGVQFEAGTAATAFERRDYGRELVMCRRYTRPFAVTFITRSDGSFVNGYEVDMRASPTATQISASFTTSYLTIAIGSTGSTLVYATGTGGGNSSGNAQALLSAEL